MLVLSVDTAGVMRTTCALSRSADDWVGITLEQSPAEALAPAIESLIEKLAARMTDISHVICGVGPGPFTGLRIGLAHANATAQVLGITASGVGSLDAVAARVPAAARPGRFLVAADARRKEVYCAVFDSALMRVEPAQVLTPAAAAAAYAGLPVVGDGARLYSDVFTAAGCTLIDDEILLSYEQGLVEAAHASLSAEPQPALPEYMREPDAVPSAPAGAQR